ncbi:MAG: HDOD domain-containing protein [Myxococcota bacterium]
MTQTASQIPSPARSSDLAETIVEELWFGDEDPKRTSQEASESMAAVMASTVGLKPFPAIATRIIQLTGEPNVGVVDIREEIETDAAVASRLLRIANSPMYAARMPCGSIDDAVRRLGFAAVRDIVAGIAAMAMFDDLSGLGQSFRDHAAGVAAIVRILALETRYKRSSDLFLCALLHDIGKLMSLQVNEVPYETFDPEVFESPDRLHTIERQVTGYDHAVLGAHVLARWNLPRDVCRTVAWHHQPGRAYAEGGDTAVMVALLRVANGIEYQIQKDHEYSAEFATELTKNSAWQYLGLSLEVFEAMWSKLIEAHHEVVQVLCD